MNKFIKDVWKALYVSIIGAIAIFIFGFLKDLISSKPFLTTFWYVLNYSVPFWVILVGVTLIALIKKNNIKIFTKREVTNQPEFLRYTQDHIKNFDWNWNWGEDQYYQQWNIISLRPICPNCSSSCTIIDNNGVNETIRCPNCELTKQVPPTTKSDVEHIIRDRANNGKFGRN